MSGEGITNNRRPLDTATLGPIRIEPNVIADRARVVRDALKRLSVDAADRREGEAFAVLVFYASDETLARLGRMVR